MEVQVKESLPPTVCASLDQLDRLVGPIYVVGGTLRNCLLRRPLTNDLDVLMTMPLERCRQKLLEAGFEAVAPGKRPNTLLVPLRRSGNPRTIVISPLRHRPGQTPSIGEDLLNRDITINAMAYRWDEGPLLDPYGGLEDLPGGDIRLVNGAATLAWDPIRALRFFRFTLQLSGDPMDEDLEQSENTSLKGVSWERIRAEMDRILSLPLEGEEAATLLKRLFASPMGADLLPEFAAIRNRPCWEHSLDAMLAIPVPKAEEDVPLLDLRWASLLHQVGPVDRCTIKDTHHLAHGEETLRTVTGVLERLHFSKRRLRRIFSIIHHLDATLHPSERNLKRLVESHVPAEALFRLIMAKHLVLAETPAEEEQAQEAFAKAMARVHHLRHNMTRISPHELALRGGEILELVRRRPGPWLGEVQRMLVEWVTNDPARNRRELLEHQVREWIYHQGME